MSKLKETIGSVLAELDTRASSALAEADSYRQLAEQLRSTLDLPGRPRPSKQTRGRSAVRAIAGGRRAPIADGSLPARILETLKASKAPMKFGDLVAEVKARAWDVRDAIHQLERDRRVVRPSGGVKTRYALPK